MQVYVITGPSPNKNTLRSSISKCEDGTLDQYVPNASENSHPLGRCRRYYCNSRHQSMLFIASDLPIDKVIKHAVESNILVLDSMYA